LFEEKIGKPMFVISLYASEDVMWARCRARGQARRAEASLAKMTLAHATDSIQSAQATHSPPPVDEGRGASEDTSNWIGTRIRDWNEHCAEIEDYYERDRKLLRMDSRGTEEEAWKAFSNAINAGWLRWESAVTYPSKYEGGPEN
jgi:adenylate kinase family enzyme